MMKATQQWIDSYVGSGLSAAEIAQRLTLAGTEVEKSEPAGTDTCFTLEVTSNRVDCLGVLGLARELAATLGKTVSLPDAAYTVAPVKASQSCSVEIEPDALGACPFYTAQVITGVTVGPSPRWLQQRLEAIGLKPINNIVDVTNFVLYETSQPLHAFDLGKLAGPRIVVRFARDKEPFRPIADRKERASIPLDSRTLVIADAQRAQAVAGVMGGADSQVGPGTRDILLESAYFEPQGNKQTGRRLELESDSGYRFQRGVDLGGVVYASRRAAKLIVEVAGGQVLDGILQAGTCAPKSRVIDLSYGLVQRVLGIDVPASQVQAILEGLGLKVLARSATGLSIEAPSFRRDLEKPIDLVEEIGRVHGLDRIPAPLRMTVAIAKPTRAQAVRAQARRALLGQGMHEALTDSFVSDKGELAACSPFGDAHGRLEARRPVNAGLPALRRNLHASLAGALAHNQRQGNSDVRLFEIARVFLPQGQSSGEREVIGLLAPDFLQAKGIVEALLEALRVRQPLTSVPLAHAAYQPGRAAQLRLGDKLLGVIGEPTAAAMKQAGAEGACALAELDFAALVEAWVEVPQFHELPRFPAAERDLAFVLDAATTWAQVEAVARAACDATLRDVRLFDEFRGKAIGAGKKSLAFRLSFRHEDRTLTSDEITSQMNAAIAAVQGRLGGTLRG